MSHRLGNGKNQSDESASDRMYLAASAPLPRRTTGLGHVNVASPQNR